MGTFSDFPLLPTLQASLAEQGLITPTEIQARALPLLLEGKSVVGVSETGSGKTLAYALPILHLLKTLENSGDAVSAEGRPRALVLVPTRELGEQVTRVFKPFTHTTRLRVRSVLGGTDIGVAKRGVQGPLEVLIATPGRLVQFLSRGLVNLGDIRFLVFDEADQMLDPGFLSDTQRIGEACGSIRQRALFSATVSPVVQKLIHELFKNAEVIRSQGSHRVVPTLKTVNMKVMNGKRLPVLEKILSEKTSGGTLIFANTRDQCDQILKSMTALGLPCAIYRGEMDKLERRANLKAFRAGTVQYLISTDLASRGLDVAHIERVINYHLPQNLDNYLHRVGRTARAGRSGRVINLVTERDHAILQQISKVQSKTAGR